MKEYMRESESCKQPIYIVKEEAKSCSQSHLRAAAHRSYRRIIASPDNKEADFQVAFSPRAGVIWVIQKEPLPHDTMGCKSTTHIKTPHRINRFIRAPSGRVCGEVKKHFRLCNFKKISETAKEN